MKKASEAFQAMRKLTFDFEHCVPYLEGIPNFNPYVTPLHPCQATSKNNVNNAIAGLGSNVCHPMGRNKMKASQRSNSSLIVSSGENAKVVLGSLVEVKEKIYQEITEKITIQKSDLMLKNK